MSTRLAGLVNPDWLAWAMRLSAELSGLLAAEGAR